MTDFISVNEADAGQASASASAALHTPQNISVSYGPKPIFDPVAQIALGLRLLSANQLDAGLAAFEAAIAAKPDAYAAHYWSAAALSMQKKPQQAIAVLEHLLALQPGHADGWYSHGSLLLETEQFEAALASIDKSLALKPRQANALNNQGFLRNKLGRVEEAVQSFEKALGFQADHLDALMGLVCALQTLDQQEEALSWLDRMLRLQPDNGKAHYFRGNALRAQNQAREALESYDRALALSPDSPGTLNNKGIVLAKLGRCEEAIACYDQAMALQSDYASALNNKGCALQTLSRNAEAVVCFGLSRSLQKRPFSVKSALDGEREDIANPFYLQTLANEGTALRALKRYRESLALHEEVLASSPQYPHMLGKVFHLRQTIGLWDDTAGLSQRLLDQVRAGADACMSFEFLSHPDADSADQLQCAESYVRKTFPDTPTAPWKAQPAYRHERIRVAYVSADLRNHPVSFLMAEVFEVHDRSRFEVIALSLRPEESTPMHARVRRTFDRYIDASQMTDAEAAQCLRDLEVDIVVDLGGHTAHSRFGILALRPAPIQVNYLGYPGTLGGQCIDYIVGDKWVTPFEWQDSFSECIVQMPHSFQANDRQRAISATIPTRQALGLPTKGFVFCCLNNSNKITSAVFDVWMRLLGQVAGSVMWLLGEAPEARENLCAQAQRRGIDPARLVFADRRDYPAYLAGFRQADLFLDTLAFNAGTTGSDALWAGLPVLTCPGNAFAGRMAASLLDASGLPELIAHDLVSYEAIALRLATHPAELAQLRQRLGEKGRSAPLFDTPVFCRHLESAYQSMITRHLDGLPPRGFAVRRIG